MCCVSAYLSFNLSIKSQKTMLSRTVSGVGGSHSPPSTNSAAAQPHRPFEPNSSRASSSSGGRKNSISPINSPVGSGGILRRRSLSRAGSGLTSVTPPVQFKTNASATSPRIVRRRVSISAQEVEVFVCQHKKSDSPITPPRTPPPADAAVTNEVGRNNDDTIDLIKRSESYAFDSSDGDSEDDDEMPSRHVAFSNARYVATGRRY